MKYYKLSYLISYQYKLTIQNKAPHGVIPLNIELLDWQTKMCFFMFAVARIKAALHENQNIVSIWFLID